MTDLTDDPETGKAATNEYHGPESAHEYESSAGEPDFKKLAIGWEIEYYQTGGDRTHGYIRYYLVKQAYSLGLAARPKVEDAEVVAVINELATMASGRDALAIFSKAANILERLAMKVTLLEVRDTGWGLQCQEAEADLRTKETQLAQAQDAAEQFSTVLHQLEQRGVKLTGHEDSQWMTATSRLEQSRHQSRQQAAEERK